MTVVTDLKIVSWSGHAINDGTNYEAGFTPGIEYGLPDVGANLVGRTQHWPVISGIDRSGRELRFIVRIKAVDTRTARDNLLLWFDPEDETPKALIIEDADGSNDRYVNAICTSLLPLTGDRAAVAEAFMVVLTIHGDVRWRAINSTSHEWTITATGDTDTVTNPGTDEAYPKLTIVPTAAKTGGSGVSYYRRFVAIRWKPSAEYLKYPLDVLDDSWDTASLIATATATTLNGALSSGATSITLTDASSFPTSGMGYITDAVNGDEQVSWTGKSSNTLTGVTRGIGGTSDVNHSNGDAFALSKMLANGDDLRVQVDGIEVDRWLDGINTSTTKAWVNMDWTGSQAWTLAAGIGSGDTLSTVTVNEDITDAPSAGTFVVNSEAFNYTDKTNATKTFTGVTRAAHGTSAGTHAADATVWWAQHSVYLTYGDETASAPSQDDLYKPSFELDHSTNTSWVYEVFGSDDGKRTAPWIFDSVNGSPTKYTGDRGANADPWTFVGCYFDMWGQRGLWKVYNPCEVTNVNFQDGEKYASDLDHYYLSLRSGDPAAYEDQISDPSTADTWESWSKDQAINSGQVWAGFQLIPWGGYRPEGYAQIGDATVTLNSSNTPAITIAAEQGGTSSGYPLNCRITNQTTSKSIDLVFLTDVNGELEVDTDLRTVKDLGDNTSQFQALSLVDGIRKNWLKLSPGDNVLEYTETGAAGLTITLEFEARYY